MITVKEFNDNYPVGAFVKYQDENGNEVTSEVRFPAELIDGPTYNDPKTAVFYAKGEPNAIPLTQLLDLYQIPHENGQSNNQD